MELKKYIKKFNKDIKNIKNKKNIKKIYKKYLGKKGYIKKIIKNIKKLPNEIKPKIGKKINNIKNYIINKINLIYKKKKYNNKENYIDIFLPGKSPSIGYKHPITSTLNKIENFFYKLGCINIIGKEIVKSYYNFDSLNIYKYHPSRSIQDTFWINKKKLLRTQTSCLLSKYINKKKPPIKIITSGCVYRKDYDNTHTPMFHQLDCFIIDKNINFCNLKYIINKFINFFFNKKKKFKFLPSFFPFTVPSAEVFIKNKKKKWIEILGCGLIHPKILKNAKINFKKYSGLALGIGIERLIMLKYNIKNIKLLYENNIELLKQF